MCYFVAVFVLQIKPSLNPLTTCHAALAIQMGLRTTGSGSLSSPIIIISDDDEDDLDQAHPVAQSVAPVTTSSACNQDTTHEPSTDYGKGHTALLRMGYQPGHGLGVALDGELSYHFQVREQCPFLTIFIRQPFSRRCLFETEAFKKRDWL